MKIVLDTNVIFAAFATRGLAHAVFELCLQQYEVVISEHILKELEGGLSGKLRMSKEPIDDILSFFREFCLMAAPNDMKKSVCRDRSDDHILGLAETCAADFIVSGDKDLLVLKKFKSIPILTPRQFWEEIRSKKG